MGLSFFLPRWIGNTNDFKLPNELPWSFHVGVTNFAGNEILVLIVVPIVLVGLVGFFRFSAVGTALRATAESADRALIVKRGGNGATLFHEGERLDVPGVPVEVVNGLGAGDSFAAALGYAIVRSLGIAEGVRLGNLAGSIVAGRVSCSEAMPTLDELQAIAMVRV